MDRPGRHRRNIGAFMKDQTTRDLIVNAANELFYSQGYGHTSFSDIAEEVQISRGNFYHHFKSKDEILGAVIDVRLASTRAMLDEWKTDGEEPAERIRRFIHHMLLVNHVKIMKSGCPIGTLCAELTKLDPDAQERVGALFTLFRDWLREQFGLLGMKSEADMLAMHLLSRTQGVAMLANAFHDEKFMRREVKKMCEWLDELTRDKTGKG